MLRKGHLKVLVASLSCRFLPPSPIGAEAFICPRIKCTCQHNVSLIKDHPANIVLDEVQAERAGFRSPVGRDALKSHVCLDSAGTLSPPCSQSTVALARCGLQD